MADKSDYKTPRTKLHELLPGVFKSEASTTMFENAFNRFLTKNETSRVAGYIGKGNPEAIVSRQLPEPTVHRQAFQLQPILNAKIGSVEYMAAWQDLLNELERLGVDTEKVSQWGKVLQFNWVPPIDLDKLINYQDYYWYDPDSPNSRPDYITIKNRCNSAIGYVNFWKRLVDEYGETIPIFTITSSGLGSPGEYDQLVFDGEYSRLFEVGFQIYIRESTNAEIDRRVFDVLATEYDSLTNTTIVRIDSILTNDSVGGGVVSLAEQYSVAIVARDCACGGDVGWDSLQWDDNIRTPLWNGDHETWLTNVSNAGPPVGTPSTNEIWYDTNADILYEYDTEGASWVVLIYNFSYVLQNTTGTALWDAADCGTGATIDSALQWVNTNKWIHKTDVPNLTIAKRAQYPIIEFFSDLELNEWTLTNHNWKYRAGAFAPWEDTTLTPGLIELIPLSSFTQVSPTVYELDPVYGDQTSWFVPGRQLATINGELITVKQSFFATSAVGAPPSSNEYRTTIELETGSPVPTGSLIPLFTSGGDLWRGYNDHWVYLGSDAPVAVGHQRENPTLALTSDPVDTTNYEYTYGFYTQNNITKFNGTPVPIFQLDSTLQNRALVGFDDVRVYLNGVRQYGTYEELSQADLGIAPFSSEYVAGIEFLAEYVPSRSGQEIRIEVGPAGTFDMGLAAVPVRTSTNDSSPTIQNVSLIRFRKIEQVKTTINQYPVFDIYNVDGSYAYQANPIFAYQTSPTEALQPALGLRIVIDETPKDFGFTQYLISEDNGTLYAYRDYTNSVSAYWYNTSTGILKIWDTLKWCTKYELPYATGTALVAPIISSVRPQSTDLIGGIIGCLWYDPISNILYRRTSAGNGQVDWTEVSGVAITTSDDGLQTIWKKGSNDEEYTPAKVDWLGRSEEEYNVERDLFIQERAEELVLTGASSVDATAQATTEWYESQINKFSSTGEWTGDWEIPDPLYYNHLHENRKVVTYRELLTHFSSIINAQPKIPGYAGPRTSMFHLILPEDVNYGIGGHIKEYNDGFDTFLSSLFVNNVTPLRLVEFAHDQYQSLLNALSETYRRKLISLLVDTSQASLISFENFATDAIITEYEQSDNTALVYGDSTTFLDAMGPTDLGMRNWIITLPYLKLIQATAPVRLVDETQGIDQLLHHDGHFDSYALPQSTIETISRAVAQISDPRAADTFGRISSSAPPTSATAFATSFATSIENRQGVYWYHVPSVGDRILYRLTVVSAGAIEPSSTLADGILWFDTATNTLRIKSGASWNVVSGLTLGDGLLDNGAGISAWAPVEFNDILNNIILDVETKLYENAPAFTTPPYDLDVAETIDPSAYQAYTEEEFLNYALEQGIVAPYRNSNYTATDLWSWNYSTTSITEATHPDQTYTGADIRGGDWRDLYQKVYGTPYPHLEPWKLLGYTSKPNWWDAEYADQTGTRRWTPAMWSNILNPISPSIPAGEAYPNGVISINGNYAADVAAGWQIPAFPDWYYVSVNTTAAAVTDGSVTYQPDDLLPPIFTSPVGALNAPNARSLFTSEPSGLAPAADYAFGDAGPIEWEWRNSSYYNYDRMAALFRVDPVRYVTHTFGKTFYHVAGLQIDSDTNNTFCHCRTDFHGEVVGDQPYLINGTNQWYVNYNRYAGFDNNYSNFHALWTQWAAPLTYQLSSFIDTQSFILGHRTVDVTSFDWRITSKRASGVEDFWYDAFKIALLEIPPPTARYNNESQWVFEVGTNLPLSRTINYYDVMNYQFYTDPDTDTCSLYTYTMVDTDTSNDRFIIAGDQTQLFVAGRTFDVTDSTANDGTYTVISSSFNVGTNQTSIAVDTVPSLVADGLIKLNYRDIPWQTGDRVFLTTQETLPYPLLNETEYFIIVLNDREFKLASTASDALNNSAIDLTTMGRRDHFVGQLNATFLALDGARTDVAWKHYAVDKNNVLSLTLPAEISGIQNIINLVDGYEVYGYDQGWRINDSGRQVDPNLARAVSWQVELERFIDYIYGIRTQRNRPVSSKFEIITDNTTDTFTFTDQYANFLTGDPVVFSSDNGVLPAPLIPRIKYYVIRTALMTFKIAGSKRDAEQGIAIDLTVPGGSPSTYNTLWVSPAQPRVAITTFELNPFRNGIDFRPERGIVSNVLEGPSEDVRTSQLIFDQYGRALGRNNLRVYRQDKQTHIAIPDQIFNDVELSSVYNNEYNYLHLGGAHLFVDAYEHVLIFNNYTSENQLLYDPFVGLNVTKFELQFRRQEEFTQRPNVGGYYLNTFFNQNVGLKRNIEASIEDLRYLYDTYIAPETETLILNSREALGYEGTREYMNNLNVGPKSQFIFWRGMIQQKGSLNAIQAFINSRRFLDAKIDEFWAVKIADFGAAGDKEYPELFLTTEDARANDIRFEFVSDDLLCLPGYAMNVFDKDPCGYAFPEDGEPVLIGSEGFTPISISDEERWYNQPDQLEMLRNNGATLYFTLKPIAVIPVSYGLPELASPPRTPVNNEGAIEVDGTTYTFKRWNASTLEWEMHGHWDSTSTFLPTLRHGMKADSVQITLSLESNVPRQEVITGIQGKSITLVHGYIPYASNIKVWKQQRVEILSVTESPEGSPYNDWSTITVPGDLTGIIQQGQTLSIIDANGIAQATVVVMSQARADLIFANMGVTVVPVQHDGGSPGVTTITLVGPAIDTVKQPEDAGSPTMGSPGGPLVPVYSPPYGNYGYIALGRELVSGVDFTETLAAGGGLLSNIIQLPTEMEATDIITVTNTSAVLAEGLHFNVVNSDVIEFSFPHLYVGSNISDAGAAVVSGSASLNTFRLVGDQTGAFSPGDTVTYVDTNSTSYVSGFVNTTFTVATVSYDSSTGITSLVTVEPIIQAIVPTVVSYNASNTITVAGNYTAIPSGSTVTVSGTSSNNGTFFIVGDPVYDTGTARTTFTVTPTSIVNEGAVGSVSIAAQPSFVGSLTNLTTPSTTTYNIVDLKVWGFTQDDKPQDPAKIIDVISSTVITNVPMWDPARGIHYYNAVHNVDLMNRTNPARYNNTLLLTQPVEPGEGFTRVAPTKWGKEQVGTTWLDTSRLEYARYYDDNAITDSDIRLGYWGRLADWGGTKAYEWVESDIPPSAWNEAAVLEENNNTLPEETRKAGRIYPTLFRTTTTGVWERLLPNVHEYDVAVEGTPVYEGSPAELVGYDLNIGSVTTSNGMVFPAAFTSGGNANLKTFEIRGDYTSLFYVDDKIFYTDTGNRQYAAPTINTEFTISDIVYDSRLDVTTITVEEEVVKYFTADVVNTLLDNQIVLRGDVSSFVGVGTTLTLSGMENEENNTTFIVTETDSISREPDVTGVVNWAWGGNSCGVAQGSAFGYASTRNLLYSLAEISPCPFGSITPTSSLSLPDGNSIAAFYHWYVTGGGGAKEVVFEVYCPGGDPGENYITGLTVGTTAFTTTSSSYLGSAWYAEKSPGIPANIRRWRWTTTATVVFSPSPAFSISFPVIPSETGTTTITVERLDGSNVGSPTFGAVINDDIGDLGYWTFREPPTVSTGGTGYAVGDIIRLELPQTGDYGDPGSYGNPLPYGDPPISYAHVQLRVTELSNYVTGVIAANGVELYTPGIYDAEPSGWAGNLINLSGANVVTVTGVGAGAAFNVDQTGGSPISDTFWQVNPTPAVATITLQPSYEGLITSQESDAYDINVYVNGLQASDYSFSIVTTIGSPTTHEYILRFPIDTIKRSDHVTVVQPVPTGDRLDRGKSTGAFREEYEYSSVVYNDIFGNEQTKYYFWVQDKITKRAKRTLSPIETERQIVSIPSPYMFFQKVRAPARVFVDGYPVDLPLRMSQNIIRGLRGLINDNRRYVIRYTRDYTLRDSLDAGTTPLQLKNKHTTWELIRQEQPSKIRRELWNRITECIIGETLDGTQRVPSLSRELYDTKYETDTRFGLGYDQAFADGTLALQAVLAYLIDPNNDFRPIDINTFFQQYSFDTQENIIAAMDRVYTAFAAIHVNKIFFSVLMDAGFAKKSKYAEIFKTSMIALHGVKPFQVGGLFDD